MKELSEVTACIVDPGLFLPLAHCLAPKCKRVLFNPYAWDRGFPSLKQGSIGAGFDNVEHCLDFWPQLHDIDLFVLPDVGRSGLQLHLESLGKAVWGSRNGSGLELGREKFMSLLGNLGLSVAPYHVCEGLTKLRNHLRDKTDKFIKISRWRGDMETTHWRNWAMDNGWLDWLAIQFGPLKETVRFLVFDKIDTDLEIGGDTHCVDGEWPDLMLNGIEWKDNSYFSAVTARNEMPQQIQDVLDAFGPVLGKYRYRNQWSMEIRVVDDKFYFIDPTCRGGMPSTASQIKVWENFDEMIWAGANGQMLQPVPAAQFSIECMVKCKSDSHTWDEVEIDPELEGHLMLSNCCKVGGIYGFPPDDTTAGDLGWLVAIGDSPTSVLEESKRLADLLPDGLDANVEALANVIKEIDSAKEHGIPFTEQELPQPAAAIE